MPDNGPSVNWIHTDTTERANRAEAEIERLQARIEMIRRRLLEHDEVSWARGFVLGATHGLDD
jgi:hypothetical protein